jgi:DNA-binding transcriptional regulator YiaG
MNKLVYMLAPGDAPRLLHAGSPLADFTALEAHIRSIREVSHPRRRELMTAAELNAFLSEHDLSCRYAADTVFQVSQQTLSRWRRTGIAGERNVAAIRYKDRWLAMLEAKAARQRRFVTLVSPQELETWRAAHDLSVTAAARRLGVGAATMCLWAKQGVRRQSHADRVRAIIG